MKNLFAYFLIPFLLAIAITPLVRLFARRYKIYAYPNHRTIHTGAVPKWGGGSIFFAFCIGAIVLYFLQPELFRGNNGPFFSLLSGAFVLFVMGSFDDKFELGCNLKLLVELAVATLVYFFGWRFEILVLPGFGDIALGWFSYPMTVLWIVGVANAINMVDGLDGLAGGIAIVVALICLGIAGLYHNTLVIALSVLLAGSVTGFLRYNLNPATIFMGDSGSLPLGFLIACITLSAASVAPGKVAVLVPALLLCLPLTDTTLAIIRRVRRGIHPFHADKEHIHHRLVRLGLSQAGAAMFMVGLSLIFGILAYLLAQGMYTDFRFLGDLLK